MAKTKMTKRTRRTPEQRAKILAAAAKEGLTAKDVQKRFGVPVVTYYSWRKKSKASKRRARRAATPATRNGLLSAKVQEAVEKRLRDALPKVIEREVGRYLDAVLGPGGRRRG
jgi:transposase-like protein